MAAFGALAVIAALLPLPQLSKAQSPEAVQKPRVASNSDAGHGKVVFQKQGCDRCHGARGEGVAARGADAGVPPLAATRLDLANFLERVRQPKGRMPPYGKRQASDQDLADVYAFLRSSALPTEGPTEQTENGKTGEELYVKYGCSECHLRHGEGARSTGGTRLGPPQIPLSAFTSYVRHPTGQMPPYTGKTVSDEELAEMYAFLQSVPQPRPWKDIPLLRP